MAAIEGLHEARRLVIQRVVSNVFGGSQREFAAAAGLRESYVSRMLEEDPAKAQKRIGEDLARRLEGIAALRLARDELLNPSLESRIERAPEPRPTPWPFRQIRPETWDSLNDWEKGAIERVVVDEIARLKAGVLASTAHVAHEPAPAYALGPTGFVVARWNELRRAILRSLDIDRADEVTTKQMTALRRRVNSLALAWCQEPGPAVRYLSDTEVLGEPPRS